MIRVLHVLGGLERGGAESFVMNVYRCLNREIIQFDFVIFTDEKQSFYDEIIEMGGKIYHFPKFNGLNLFKLRKLWSVFLKDHTEYRVLHSHIRSFASIYIPIAKKYNLTTIVHAHSTSNGKGIKAFVKKILQFPLRFQADYLFSCSKNAGEWLYGKNVFKKSNFYLVHNAIAVDNYLFSKNISEYYRKKYGLDNKFVLGHVGRFHEAKNHMFLLDIFEKVSKYKKDAVLFLIGDGPQKNEILNKIYNLGLQDKVVLAGICDNVPELLQCMDVFIFPSLWEGFPITVLEAQASGLPCFISDTITEEVRISDLVKVLPINSVDDWVRNIFNIETFRMDVSDLIKSAGFDIQNVSKWLFDFYLNIQQKGV